MRKRFALIIFLLTLLLVLSGCKTTLLVHNATVAQVIPIFKDYAGSHGYTLTYQNDQTGSYGLDLGPVFVSATSDTTMSRSVIIQPSNQPMSAYEETTWHTVSTPGHFDEATASVNIVQQGSDVLVIIDGNSAAGGSLNDAHDYIQQRGYTVDTK